MKSSALISDDLLLFIGYLVRYILYHTQSWVSSEFLFLDTDFEGAKGRREFRMSNEEGKREKKGISASGEQVTGEQDSRIFQSAMRFRQSLLKKPAFTQSPDFNRKSNFIGLN